TLGRYGVRRGAEILDAGCGAGLFTSFMAYAGFVMTGLDVSATAISSAKARGGAEYINTPLCQPGTSKKFDVALCLDVFFHIVDDDEWEKSLITLAAYVKSKGLLCIIEHFPSPEAKSAVHCKWRSLDVYEQTLQRS